MTSDVTNAGERMIAMMRELWPICRSLTGDGNRQTLAIIKRQLPELSVSEVPTGTRCFDWTIPQEWNVREAYVVGPDGRRVIDFAAHNLHLVGYSEPIDQEYDLAELQPHLHSLPEQPDAIPFVTSYYRRTWGFCLAHRQRELLPPGRYRVRIDSELKDGSLTYGELLLPGTTDREIFFSTYICHPSMANNELSGPCVTTALASWLRGRDRRYSYRIIFVPETIGAIYYLSRHLAELKRRVAAGFVMTCMGDERAWSFMPSRHGQTLSDRAARHVLAHVAPGHVQYSFLQRGSDERQYCSPGVDLPVSSIMRSKYVTFPEYHTSLDNLDFVTAAGLAQTLVAHQRLIEVLEGDCTPVATVLGEPRMGDRGLRPTLGAHRGLSASGMRLMNLLAYADGTRSLLEIAEVLNEPAWELRPAVDLLRDHGLLRID